jgi:ectoine hydroxylase-related dioxygenase (phytanoyl-CoA dioxygenase family)
VPGSHLWGDAKPDFGDGSKGVVDVDMEAGDAFLMLGSLYHAGGEFRLEKGDRMMHIMFCCSGNMRQEVRTVTFFCGVSRENDFDDSANAVMIRKYPFYRI